MRLRREVKVIAAFCRMEVKGLLMKRTKIIDALQSTDYGKEINVKGWVRTHRSSKAVDFIALNDGSTIKNIQVVVDPSSVDEETLKSITTGLIHQRCRYTRGESGTGTGFRSAMQNDRGIWTLWQRLPDAEEGTVVRVHASACTHASAHQHLRRRHAHPPQHGNGYPYVFP